MPPALRARVDGVGMRSARLGLVFFDRAEVVAVAAVGERPRWRRA